MMFFKDNTPKGNKCVTIVKGKDSMVQGPARSVEKPAKRTKKGDRPGSHDPQDPSVKIGPEYLLY